MIWQKWELVTCTCKNWCSIEIHVLWRHVVWGFDCNIVIFGTDITILIQTKVNLNKGSMNYDYDKEYNHLYSLCWNVQAKHGFVHLIWNSWTFTSSLLILYLWYHLSRVPRWCAPCSTTGRWPLNSTMCPWVCRSWRRPMSKVNFSYLKLSRTFLR